MKILVIIFIIILILALLLFCLFAVLCNKVIHPKRLDIQDMQDREMAKDFMRDFSFSYVDEHELTCNDGYKIRVMRIPAPEESKKYVIIHHGYTANRSGALKYANIFNKLGYNCIILDARAHGANAEGKCSFGIQEKYDLLDVIQDTYDRYGQDIHLGIHGESMGSIISLQTLGLKPNIDFLVADCGAARLKTVLRTGIHDWFHLPRFFADLACMVSKLVYGVDLASVNPLEALVDNDIPVCFAHGAEDTLIFCENSRIMHESNRGYSELHLYSGADHAQSIDKHPEDYESMIISFLEKVYLQNN